MIRILIGAMSAFAQTSLQEAEAVAASIAQLQAKNAQLKALIAQRAERNAMLRRAVEWAEMEEAKVAPGGPTDARGALLEDTNGTAGVLPGCYCAGIKLSTKAEGEEMDDVVEMSGGYIHGDRWNAAFDHYLICGGKSSKG